MPFNKAITAIDAAYKKVPGLPQQMGQRWIEKWHGVSGVIQAHAHTSMLVDANGDVRVNGLTPPVLTKAQGRQLAQAIDTIYVGADHLDVKQNATWRGIYHYQNIPFAFINAAGVGITSNQDVMPCHNCGIVLPMDCVQVDHHMPQAGGDSLYTLKILRALGLTTMAATGGKGAALAGGLAVVLNPSGRARGDYNHLVNATAAGKWTTNDRGSAFLSLMKLAGGLPDLFRMCKNSLLNLVPLCPACNREKSDWIKPIV